MHRGELRVRHPHLLQPIDRIRDRADALEGLGERPEIERGELGDQRFLVPEVVVDRRRRVADLRRDGAHRRPFVTALHKHPPRGFEKLAARFGALALTALEAVDGACAHNCVRS